MNSIGYLVLRPHLAKYGTGTVVAGHGAAQVAQLKLSLDDLLARQSRLRTRVRQLTGHPLAPDVRRYALRTMGVDPWRSLGAHLESLGRCVQTGRQAAYKLTVQSEIGTAELRRVGERARAITRQANRCARRLLKLEQLVGGYEAALTKRRRA